MLGSAFACLLLAVAVTSHECEENRCKKCSFVNYFVTDPTLSAKVAKFSSTTTFSEEYGVDFLLDSIVEWKEYQEVGVALPGKRKYDHILYKTCRGTMSDFPPVFQRGCIKLKTHKFYLHRCNERKLLSLLDSNITLLPEWLPCSRITVRILRH